MAIFHIAAARDWDAAVATGSYRVSTRGRSLDEVGFIHCSHRHQVERVANAAYRGAGPLYLLRIDPARLGQTELREESAGGIETFPHLYGPLPVGAVVDTAPLAPLPGGLFVPSTSWLSPKLQVGPSPIEGVGLMATDTIAPGEPVAVMGGTVLTDEEFAAFVASVETFSAAAIDEGLNVLQDADDPLARGNHSCDPTLWMADELTLLARRAIRPAQEVTVDYCLMTVSEEWSMDCRCGTAGCRGTVTGNDWHRADLQARYRGHFSPFIERRIAAGHGAPPPRG
jgi:uncharacterized protein (DUF952 family)